MACMSLVSHKHCSQKKHENSHARVQKSPVSAPVFETFFGGLSSCSFSRAEPGSPPVVLDRARDERQAKTDEIEPEIVGALVPECDKALSV